MSLKLLVVVAFEEYPDDKQMHCTARLVDMLNSYASELQNSAESNATKDFLMEEIKVLEEAKFIGLPNFMPRTAFLTLLQKKVRGISYMPINFVESVWNYLETVVVSVLNRHSANYYQLQVSIRRAAEHLISKKKKNSIQHVLQAVEMEKLTDYTGNPEYLQEYNKLMSHREVFLKEVLNVDRASSTVKLEGVGDIDVVHLMKYPQMLNQAYDLKVRLIAYWKIVLRRFKVADSQFSLIKEERRIEREVSTDIWIALSSCLSLIELTKYKCTTTTSTTLFSVYATRQNNSHACRICTLKMGMNLKFILQRTTPKSGKGSLVDNQRISNDSLDVLIISTSLSRLYIKE
ncbi:dynamin central region protein [Medicago truncatula]|uniref:Dynamin central region protein n=1 Tax=Medicago truncatula TaxID=3880 RepID=A0A072U4D9_MEDTR|nr:dynamin central region protein [Medicago truncatula]